VLVTLFALGVVLEGSGVLSGEGIVMAGLGRTLEMLKNVC